MTTKERLLKVVNDLIEEGTVIERRCCRHEDEHGFRANPADFAAFQVKCQNLIRLLGTYGETWSSSFKYINPGTAWKHVVETIVGALQGVHAVIQDDLLMKIESLVMADAFADFIEQSEALLNAGYHHAAAVLMRGVLEEHLKKWCQRDNCFPVPPNGKKPTINNYAQELKKNNHLSELDRKRIEFLAGVGNDAAHNPTASKAQDVEQMVKEVPAFIALHPI